jgi:hypothetical protein
MITIKRVDGMWIATIMKSISISDIDLKALLNFLEDLLHEIIPE